jgi:sec-independent protein translocase protein TatA
MFRQIGTGEIILIVAVLVLFFGSKKLPDLARSIGKSARELRAGLSGEDEDDAGSGASSEAPSDSGVGDEPEGVESD